MPLDIQIQGKYVGSTQELMLAVALDQEKLKYLYQIPILGGTWRRGGYVLDFLVFNPFPTAVPVQGNYWHESELSTKERIFISILERLYGNANVKPIWESEMQDADMVRNWVRSELK
jgi:hypothetical protein